MAALASHITPLLTPIHVAYYAIAINLWAFVAFGLDKAHAEARRRRIPEASLLRLALLGGSPGAYVGRQLFRHKTRKQPFSSHLHTIAVLQAAGLAAVLAWRFAA